MSPIYSNNCTLFVNAVFSTVALVRMARCKSIIERGHEFAHCEESTMEWMSGMQRTTQQDCFISTWYFNGQ